MKRLAWLYRYKVYHIPFWFLYHLLWWTLYTGSPAAVIDGILHSAYSIKFLFYIVFQAAGVYVNLYFLFSVFLQRGKYGSYLLWLALTTLVVAACITCGYFVSDYFSALTFVELYGEESGFWKLYGVTALPSTVAAMTLGMSVKLAKNWLVSEQKRHELEKEKLETELKYLKSQINPHFLFNTINSIFALIHRNPDLASESLAAFSGMLRHQLYECNDSEIALRKELYFLENFAELEKLRIDEQQTEVTVEVKNGVDANQRIAPFILMPFVENAFKHG